MVGPLAFIAALVSAIGCMELGKIMLPEKFPHRPYSALGVGMGVLIAILFILFAINLATRTAFLILFILLAAAALRYRPSLRLGTDHKRRAVWEYVALIVIGCLIVVHFLGASAPSIDADGLAYHMLVPDLWVAEGGFSVIGWNMYAPWPMNFDLLYGAGLAFDSQQYGRYLHFLFGIFALMLTYRVGKEMYGHRAGLLASLTLYTLPMVGVLSGTSYVDLFVLYFGLLFFTLCHEYAHGDHARMPFVIGLVLGALIGSKIIGYAFSIPMGLFFLWISWKKHAMTLSLVRTGALFLTGALILSLPWLIKSWMMMGNPVWPFLYDVFGGQHWNAFAAQGLSAEVAGGISRSISTFLLFPFYLTFQSNLTGEMGFIGPLFLSFAGIALYLLTTHKVGKKEGGFLTDAFVFIMLNLIAFFFLLHQMRYIIFLFPLLAIIAGGILTKKWDSKPFHALLASLFIIAICANMPFTLAYNGKSAGVAIGTESEDAYLTRNLDAYEPIAWINKNTHEDARIFTDGEVRTFYLEREHIWGSPNRQIIIDYSSIMDGEDLHAALKEENITHYMTSAHAMRVRQRSERIWDIDREFTENHCTTVFESENGMVCALR